MFRLLSCRSADARTAMAQFGMRIIRAIMRVRLKGISPTVVDPWFPQGQFGRRKCP